MKLSHIVNAELQVFFADAQYFAWFAAMCRTYNTGNFKLVHKSSCTIVTDGELTLYHASRTLLGLHYHPSNFLEHGVKILHIYIRTITLFTVQGYWW